MLWTIQRKMMPHSNHSTAILRRMPAIFTQPMRNLAAVSPISGITDAALQAANFKGKRVIDVGCGDGAYTAELFDRGHPLSIFAFDPAYDAIEIARQHAGLRAITYGVNSAYKIPAPDSSFDIATFAASFITWNGHMRFYAKHSGSRRLWWSSSQTAIILCSS